MYKGCKGSEGWGEGLCEGCQGGGTEVAGWFTVSQTGEMGAKWR